MYRALNSPGSNPERGKSCLQCDGIGLHQGDDSGSDPSACQADRVRLSRHYVARLGAQLARHKVPAAAMSTSHSARHSRHRGQSRACRYRRIARRNACGAAPSPVPACRLRTAQRQRLDGADHPVVWSGSTRAKRQHSLTQCPFGLLCWLGLCYANNSVLRKIAALVLGICGITVLLGANGLSADRCQATGRGDRASGRNALCAGHCDIQALAPRYGSDRNDGLAGRNWMRSAAWSELHIGASASPRDALVRLGSVGLYRGRLPRDLLYNVVRSIATARGGHGGNRHAAHADNRGDRLWHRARGATAVAAIRVACPCRHRDLTRGAQLKVHLRSDTAESGGVAILIER